MCSSSWPQNGLKNRLPTSFLKLSALAHEVRDIVAHGYEISVKEADAELKGAGKTIRFKRASADKVKSS
jgi:DNA-binding IclR family transcriptional regulator